jgi:hypothetical protein
MYCACPIFGPLFIRFAHHRVKLQAFGLFAAVVAIAGSGFASEVRLSRRYPPTTDPSIAAMAPRRHSRMHLPLQLSAILPRCDAPLRMVRDEARNRKRYHVLWYWRWRMHLPLHHGRPHRAIWLSQRDGIARRRVRDPWSRSTQSHQEEDSFASQGITRGQAGEEDRSEVPQEEYSVRVHWSDPVQ